MTNPTNKPKADSDSIVRGKRMALAAYIGLSEKRSTLFRQTRRTPADTLDINVLLEEMPASAPNGSSTQREWCDFIGAVSKTVAGLNSIQIPIK